MIVTHRCIGIDVSKQTLDIFDEAVGTPRRIANAPEAILQEIADWRAGKVFVVFEATGLYDHDLTVALHAAGIRCKRVNPARIRAFAKACGRLAKTDAIDAAVIAAFARTMAPAADTAPSPARETLARHARRRDQLVRMRSQERNRLSEERDPTLTADLQRHIAMLTQEIAAIEARLQDLIAADPAIAEDARLLRSAPGVGPVACTQLLAQMPELGHTGPKQVAALAGLAPFNVDSGSHRGTRSIGAGRKRVRDALYMAALNAVRRNGPSKTFYQRLRADGKAAKLALIAVARKLLTTLNAMLRDRKPYCQPAAT